MNRNIDNTLKTLAAKIRKKRTRYRTIVGFYSRSHTKGAFLSAVNARDKEKTITFAANMRKSILYTASLLLSLWSVFPLLTTAATASAKNFTVVIDAGHGGHDPGAIGKNAKEKNINLNVALKLGRLIQSGCTDTKVIYTRSTDVFVPLHQRAEIANNAKADLFISIHTNSVASRNSQVQGTETYTLGLHRTQENLEVAKKENSVILIEDDYKKQYAGFNPNSAESYIIFEFLQDKYMAQSVSFAKQIQRQFRQTAGRTDKGVHQAGFLVLRETSMPSVLIELGYITNPSEEAYLQSDNGSSSLARSIYEAFLRYRQQRGYSADKAVAQAEKDSDEPQPQPAVAPTQPETKTVEPLTPAPTETEQAKKQEKGTETTDGKPVFKIQILTSNKILPDGNSQFKGLSPVTYYKENGIYKYTFCESTDYNYVLRQKRNLVDAKFSDAFIIAFKDGEKMNVSQAIKEFKSKR